MIKTFYFLKQPEDCSGNKSCIILIRLKIFEESILLLFSFWMFSDSWLPIAAEHCMSLAWTCLSIGENSEIVSFRNFGYVLGKKVKEILLVCGFRYGLIELDGERSDCIGGYINGFGLILGIKIHLQQLQQPRWFLFLPQLRVWLLRKLWWL